MVGDALNAIEVIVFDYPGKVLVFVHQHKLNFKMKTLKTLKEEAKC
jgi:hypothetical protein